MPWTYRAWTGQEASSLSPWGTTLGAVFHYPCAQEKQGANASGNSNYLIAIGYLNRSIIRCKLECLGEDANSGVGIMPDADLVLFAAE